MRNLLLRLNKLLLQLSFSLSLFLSSSHSAWQPVVVGLALDLVVKVGDRPVGTLFGKQVPDVEVHQCNGNDQHHDDNVIDVLVQVARRMHHVHHVGELVQLARRCCCCRGGSAGAGGAGGGAGTGGGAAARTDDVAAVLVTADIVILVILMLYMAQFLVRHGLALGPADWTAVILQGHLTFAGAIHVAAEGNHALCLAMHTIALIAAFDPTFSMAIEHVQSLGLTDGIRTDLRLIAAMLADAQTLLAIAASATVQPIVFSIPHLGAVGLRPAFILPTALAWGIHGLWLQFHHHLTVLAFAAWNVARLAHTFLGQTALGEIPVRHQAAAAAAADAATAVAHCHRGHFGCGARNHIR